MWIRLAAAVFAGAGLGAAVSAQELVQVFEVNPVEGGRSSITVSGTPVST